MGESKGGAGVFGHPLENHKWLWVSLENLVPTSVKYVDDNNKKHTKNTLQNPPHPTKFSQLANKLHIITCQRRIHMKF